MTNYNLIVRCDVQNGIARKGKIPWHSKSEMRYFRKLTTHATTGKKNTVIMGRQTRESLPTKYRTGLEIECVNLIFYLKRSRRKTVLQEGLWFDLILVKG